MKNAFKKLEVEWREKELPLLIERDFPLRITDDVLAIIGPRRVGKTYLMYQLLHSILPHVSKEQILFIDFEDNRLVGLKVQQADDMFIAHQELTSSPLQYLFFDEIQALPQWSSFVRKLHNQQKYKIIVSGSSAKLLSKEIATELRGRYKAIFVSPFSFQEFLKMKQFDYSPKIEFSEKKGMLLSFFQEYMENGGYPEIIKEEQKLEKRLKIQSYFQTIFYKDIVERHQITNYSVLEQLMGYLLNNAARVFSISQFEKVLKEKGVAVSKKTLSLYLKYLEEAFFIYAVEEFSYSAKKRIMRPKKVYLIDNGLITFLSTQFSPDLGRLLENCVLIELKKRGQEVFYYHGKQECDFLVKDGLQIRQAIQVCYDFQPYNEKREVKGLQEAMDIHHLRHGLLLTYDQEKKISIGNKHIQIMPVWKWLLQKK